MILVLLRDGSTLEMEQGFDVIHKPDCIVCIDSWGASIATFLAEDVLAYSLKASIAQEFMGGLDAAGASAKTGDKAQ